jgi:ribose-phosphate pyrophosphokinase
MSMLVFSTLPYGYLRDAVCRAGGFEAGLVDTRTFPDGERYQRLATPVGDRDVALIAGTICDEQTPAIFDLACGLVEGGARRLTLVLPYFGYSTMDRAHEPGEIVAAKTRAALLSAIPRAAQGNRVGIVDPHSDGLPYYFDAGLGAAEIDVSPLVERIARRVAGTDFVLASTDAGRAKWVQRLARRMGVPGAFAHKRRLGPDRTEIVALVADVRGRHVVLYDDMIRSGASMLGAAKAYRDAGASAISAITTHGVLPGDSLQRLRASGLFDRLIATDSHPRAPALASGREFLAIEPVAPLIADFLAGVEPVRPERTAESSRRPMEVARP